MADWEEANVTNGLTNGHHHLYQYGENDSHHHQYQNGENDNHSRQSSLSLSSGVSDSNRENDQSARHQQDVLDRQSSVLSENSTIDNSSERELILARGSELGEESRTESAAYENFAIQHTDIAPPRPPKATLTVPGTRQPPTVAPMSWSGSTAKEKAAKSPYASSTLESIPEENFTIPKDANISSFTVNQMANFLQCLKVDDRIVNHLHRKSVDGKRFARLKDSELENLGMKNPVLVYFRDRSIVKPVKKKGPFML